MKHVINECTKLKNEREDLLKELNRINKKKVDELFGNKTEIIVNNTIDNSIDLKFNESLTNLSNLFKDIINLEEIDITGLNINDVLDMEKLFSGCTSLKYANLSYLEASKLDNMKSMFEGCTNLELIDMQNFNTKNVKNMNSMFKDCQKLKKININYFDLSKASDTVRMFATVVY